MAFRALIVFQVTGGIVAAFDPFQGQAVENIIFIHGTTSFHMIERAAHSGSSSSGFGFAAALSRLAQFLTVAFQSFICPLPIFQPLAA
jgi:hypothetical protein